jgi:chemotaxis protein CheD
MRYVVGVADMKISTKRDDEIITFALGSCLGIAIYDPVAAVGGLLHVMLPTSSIDLQKAAQNPTMFVDTGVPKLFIESYRAGAVKQRLLVKAAGGACVNDCADDFFQIGKRNITMLRKLLWKNGVALSASDVGLSCSRTMSLHLSDGSVMITKNGKTTAL